MKKPKLIFALAVTTIVGALLLNKTSESKAVNKSNSAELKQATHGSYIIDYPEKLDILKEMIEKNPKLFPKAELKSGEEVKVPLVSDKANNTKDIPIKIESVNSFEKDYVIYKADDLGTMAYTKIITVKNTGEDELHIAMSKLKKHSEKITDEVNSIYLNGEILNDGKYIVLNSGEEKEFQIKDDGIYNLFIENRNDENKDKNIVKVELFEEEEYTNFAGF